MNFKAKAQLYPKNLGDKLGYNRILDLLKDACQSKLGKQSVQEISVYTDQSTIAVLLNQVDEFNKLGAIEDISLPPTNFDFIQKEIDRLSISGAVLSQEQLLLIRAFLRQWARFVKLLRRFQEEAPDLHELSLSYPYEKEILASIEAVFDEQGEIRHEVSTTLNKIRTEIKKTLKVQDKRFESLLRKGRQEKWLSEEEQTVRNGRRVLSMLSENKRMIRGIIHDESSTGKTTFLEPQSLVELGNDLFDLRQKEKKEIFRIFSQLCDEIRPFTQNLRAYQDLAGKVDLVQAKATIAKKLGAIFPNMRKDGGLYLHEAYHPLLYLTYKEMDRDVVPLKLELKENRRVLMISGPNAGGKSICLKTIGLLQLMFQSGIPVPVGEHGSLSIYKQIFLDMGDDQSLENDLSTYSSHLKGLKHFANFADKDTLFLLDEFGTGTDPQFGGAIAEAVMDHLVQSKAYGVATTHYSNLKLYAEEKKGVENASMLFDQENMRPTYRLQIGRPGSSYAFEIAQRIGINKTILQYAKERVGKNAGSFEDLVTKLEKEKLALERKLSSAEEKEQKYGDLLNEYKQLKADLKSNRQKMALDYKTQLQNELKNQNKRFEKTLAELKKSNKSQEQVAKELRQKIQKNQSRVEKEVDDLKEKVVYQQSDADDLKEGDSVQMIEGTQTGILEEIRGKKAVVSFNHLKTQVALKELRKAEGKSTPKKSKTRGVDVSNYIMDFKSSIDLRGMRANDAIKAVEELIDHAHILNQKKVRIVHGKGDGILKKKVAEYLRSTGQVKGFYFDHPDAGGDGVTVVELG